MPLNNLRSMTALCRNCSTGSRHNSYSSRNVINGAKRLLTRASGLTVGAGLGYILFGDITTFLEEDRQQRIRDYYWWFPFDIDEEDLTEKMWPELKELREKTWFQNMERKWSGLKDKMFSDSES